MRASLKPYKSSVRFSRFIANTVGIGREDWKFYTMKFLQKIPPVRWIDKLLTGPGYQEVEIESHDIGAVNHTLALVIVPTMEAFVKNQRALFGIDREDVIRLVGINFEEVPGHRDSPNVIYCREAQKAMLKEIIIAFKASIEGKPSKRADYGRHLFAKYFNKFYDQP